MIYSQWSKPRYSDQRERKRDWKTPTSNTTLIAAVLKKQNLNNRFTLADDVHQGTEDKCVHLILHQTIPLKKLIKGKMSNIEPQISNIE